MNWKKGEIINYFSFSCQHIIALFIFHTNQKKWQQINYFGHWTSWPSTPKKNCYKNDNLYNRFVQRNVQRLSRARKKLKSFCKLKIKIDIEHTKCVTPFLICLFHLFEFLSEKYYSEMSQPLFECRRAYFT